MRASILVLGLAGCGFQPGSGGGGGGRDDGPSSGPIDAHVDAPPDSFVYLDAPAPGALSVTRSVVPDGDLDLTGEGTIDWAHWGRAGATSFDHKATVNAISDATSVNGATFISVGGTSLSASWTDGTPTASAFQTGTGTATATGGGGLQIDAPADPTPRTLRVYLGARNANLRVDVALSDSSAPSYTDQFSAVSAVHDVYVINYRATHPSSRVVVTMTDVANTAMSQAFVMLLSATLQ